MSSIYDPYNSSASAQEIDLRAELHQTLYGSTREIPKGKIGLLRVMRRDTDNNPIRCSCRNRLTDEPERDSFCRYCHGHGYFWDEHKIVYYKNDDSFRKREGRVQEYPGDLFYLEYSETVAPGDFLIEISLDSDGVPVQPIERQKEYAIISADHFRADRGRVEFWRLRAKFQRNWSVWYDRVKNRQSS